MCVAYKLYAAPLTIKGAAAQTFKLLSCAFKHLSGDVQCTQLRMLQEKALHISPTLHLKPKCQLWPPHRSQSHSSAQGAHSGEVTQANDERFVNACVSFDIQTLRPKYELLWGSSGKSNALAVAEGLRFDPLVLKEAAEIARGRDVLRLKPGDASNSIRAQAMQVS